MKRLSYDALVVTTVCQTIVPAALAFGSPRTSLWTPRMPESKHQKCSESGIDIIDHRGDTHRSALATSYAASALFLALSAAPDARVRSTAASLCRLPRSVEETLKQTTV